MSAEFEQLGLFYLGRPHDLESGETDPQPLLYDSRDLLTHGLIVGMTGSGKTGLGVGLIEEAALDGIPSIVIDPKGDMGNLLLTFPELAAADFLPWMSADDAARKELSVEELAERTANTWRKGIASYGQSPDRIRRLREEVDLTIYTPGSSAGTPISVLASLDAPTAAVRDDRELLLERVATTVASLLGLLGLDGDPLQSREHILLATLLEQFWLEGRHLDLPSLIGMIQSPPIDRIGVLELDSFFPPKERLKLAMTLNNLLASPTFAGFLDGEPLDVDRLLYTESGGPRVAIISVAHLSERERMFVVTLILGQILTWTRTRAGTTGLRALVYMDELFGYLPPVAEPPSKRPLLTLLKQARAFGVGLLLSTQNPVDIDYKALSNIGTWFLGRLQTERDKQRLLDGLEGVDHAGGFSRRELDQTLSSMPGRVFLVRNIHEPEQVTFKTRWVLSYLKGPLTRQEIKRLSGREAIDGAGAPMAPSPPPAPPAVRKSPAESALSESEPRLSPEIVVRYEPTGPGATPVALEPVLIGQATVRFTDRRTDLDHTDEITLVTALPAAKGSVGWAAAEASPWALEDLATEPPAAAGWEALPAEAAKPASFERWGRALRQHLFESHRIHLLFSPDLGATSRPDEDERGFRIRLAELAREERSRRLDEIREKAAKRLDRLEGQIDRAERIVATQKGQLREQQVQTVVSVGETIFGAILGRRIRRRASTAARGAARTHRESVDVKEAMRELQELQVRKQDLEHELSEALETSRTRLSASRLPLEERIVAPLKRNVKVQVAGILWRRALE